MQLTKLRSHTTAFSLVELMIAVGLFAVSAAASIGGLIRMNHNAALSRLQTGASTLVQNRIDQILGDVPFAPAKSQIPPVLEVGTQTIGSSSNPTVAVYTDPASGQVSVWGWLISTVADTGALSTRQATVSVFYQFRGQTYSVTMDTVRTPDE